MYGDEPPALPWSRFPAFAGFARALPPFHMHYQCDWDFDVARLAATCLARLAADPDIETLNASDLAVDDAALCGWLASYGSEAWHAATVDDIVAGACPFTDIVVLRDGNTFPRYTLRGGISRELNGWCRQALTAFYREMG